VFVVFVFVFIGFGFGFWVLWVYCRERYRLRFIVGVLRIVFCLFASLPFATVVLIARLPVFQFVLVLGFGIWELGVGSWERREECSGVEKVVSHFQSHIPEGL
jgi:hypothetical protein